MQKQIIQLLALLVVMLIIWFIVPMIAINNIPLLPTVTAKLITISLVSIGWLVFLVLKSPKQTAENHNQISILLNFLVNNLLALKKISQKCIMKKQPIFSSDLPNKNPYFETNLLLTKHFQKVQDYISSRSKKTKHPIYLVIGHSHSGKSTLIRNSGLQLKTLPAEDGITEEIDIESNGLKNTLWHIDSNYIFTDVPGEYANSEIEKKMDTPWHTLINLLVRKYQKYPIKAVILVIDIHDLLSNSQQNSRIKLHLLKHRLQDLKKYYGETLPLHLVFTKWDAVQGFSEFFDNLTESERNENIIIRFEKDFTEYSVTSQFKKQFEYLLQQMHHQLISKMHHEYNHDKRTAISQFPSQMEQIKKQLFYVVKQLLEKMSDCDAITAASVSFTSSIQCNDTIDLIQKNLQANLHLPTTTIIPSLNPLNKPYFIRNLFKWLVDSEPNTVIDLRITQKSKYTIYGCAAGILLLFGGFCIYKFTKSLTAVNQAEQTTYALAMLQENVRNPQAKMNATEELLRKVNGNSSFWLSSIFPDKNISGVNNQAPNIEPNIHPPKMPQAITDSLPVKNYLEQQLTDSKLPPPQLFNTLKAYLMLANPKHLEVSWLNFWMQNNLVANNIISNNDASKLIQLAEEQALYQINNKVVLQARQQLASLPKQYLTFLILQSITQDTNVKNLTINLLGKQITVPLLFTAQGLQTLFLNNIKTISEEASSGNWILGKLNTTESNFSIENQIIALYTTNYINWWSHVLSSLSIPSFNGLKSLAAFSNQLINPDSGLIANLAIIQNNINPNVILPTRVNDPLINSIRNALAQQTQNKFPGFLNINLNELQNSLVNYDQILTNLAASNSDQQAFIFLQNIFQNSNQTNPLSDFSNDINNLPAQIKEELSAFSQQTMPLVQKAAIHYLKKAWKSEVVDFYDAKLKQRYPLYSKAPQDTNLMDFTHFFAPNGILESFFNQYLTMFIDSSQPNWTTKTVNGISMPFSVKFLQALEKARIITAMFFPNESNTINVQFTLQQIALMPIVKSFQLTINGQSLNDQQGSQNISTFIWPGNSDNLSSQLMFVDVNGQNVSTIQNGPWSWFHIVDHSYLHSDGSSQKYIITFDVDGTEARYHLTTDDPINPFIPGIIDSFRLPKKIIAV